MMAPAAFMPVGVFVADSELYTVMMTSAVIDTVEKKKIFKKFFFPDLGFLGPPDAVYMTGLTFWKKKNFFPRDPPGTPHPGPPRGL